MKYLFSFITLSLALIVVLPDYLVHSARVELVLTIVIFISSFSLFYDEARMYSLYKTFNVFFLFFMGIAPLIQFKNGVQFWGGAKLLEFDYFVTACWTLIIIVLYNVFYFVFKSRNIKFLRVEHLFEKRSIAPELNNITKNIILFIAISLFLFIFYLNGFNFTRLLVREYIDNANSIEVNQIMFLIINNVIRPMNIILFIVCFAFYRKYKFFIICLFILAVLTMAPSSTARFAAAAVYIPVALVLCPLMRKKHIYVIAFIFGILVLWPFLNIFRAYSDNSQIQLKASIDVFLAGDMDSFSSFMRVLKYDIITNGNQLLGTLFFYIPRAWWADKPIGSGAYMSDCIGLSWQNISCNYFAEGYINFGYIGIILFVVFIAWFTASMDNTYWDNHHYNKNSVFEIFYFLSFGLMFFILRGDLLSSTAYFVGFSVSLLVVYYILSKKCSI